MEELVNRIVAKTGLSMTQAENVARVTINFLRDRLPPEAAVDIDEALVRSRVGL